jgi:hypothetical protein
MANEPATATPKHAQLYAGEHVLPSVLETKTTEYLRTVMFCESCGRKTEYLFDGFVVQKATRYNPKTKKPIGLVDVHRDAKVCQRCRPPSNLEIQEILEEGKYKGHTLELHNTELRK